MSVLYQNKCITDQTSVPINGQDKIISYRMNENGDLLYEPGSPYSPYKPVNRKGHAIFGGFVGAGDKTVNCRSTYLYGTDQDYQRTLDNPTTKYTNNIAERGIELYENFGLCEANRGDEGLYGNPDTDNYYNFNQSSFFSTTIVKQQAISDFGRKVCLYGNVEFALFDYGLRPNYITTKYQDSVLGSTLLENIDGTYTYPVDYIYPSYKIFGNNRFYTGLTDMSGPLNYVQSDPTFNMIKPFLSGWVYRIKFNTDSYNDSAYYNPIGGNSAVEIHSFNGKIYRITSKNRYFLTTTDYVYQNKRYLLTYWDESSQTLWFDSTFWFLFPAISNGVLFGDGSYGDNPTFISSPTGTLWNIKPGESTPSNNPATTNFTGRSGNIYSPWPASPITYCSAGDSTWTDMFWPGKNADTQSSYVQINPGSNSNTQTQNPTYAHGFKSMYIPPHMELQSFTQFEYDPTLIYESNDYNNRHYDYGVVYDNEITTAPGQQSIFNTINDANTTNQMRYLSYKQSGYTMSTSKSLPDNYTMQTDLPNERNTLPLIYSDSSMQNGTFHTFGTNKMNSVIEHLSGYFNYISTVQRTEPGNTAGIYNCSLIGLKVAIRTTPDFFDKYVGFTSTSMGSFFVPEILLVPGFNHGHEMIDIASDVQTNKGLNTFQKINNVANYWQTLAAADEDSEFPPGNPYYGETYYENMENTMTAPGITLNTSKSVTDVIPAPPTDSTLAKMTPSMFRKKRKRVDTSNYRIIDFDIYNGIYSLEWIYVLGFCAIKCTAAYDSTTGIYSYPNCNTSDKTFCCRECMLFNDPAYTGGTISGGQSQSLLFMNNYCGLRNTTRVYAPMQINGTDVLTNECKCQIGGIQYCKSSMDSDCSKATTSAGGSATIYVGDDVVDDECTQQDIDTYCSMVVNQLDIAGVNGSNLNDENIANIEAQCGTIINVGDPEDEDDTDDTTSTYLWILLVFLIIAIIAIIIGGYIYWRKTKKDNVD